MFHVAKKFCITVFDVTRVINFKDEQQMAVAWPAESLVNPRSIQKLKDFNDKF